MGEHLNEYLDILEEDPKYRDFVKNDPHQAMSEARLSHDEKAVFLSGDPDKVAKETGKTLSPAVRDVITEVGKHL
ncbi:hypothetical protein [Ferruginivarius sediminum]|uniref:Extradiol ring-cleavage dioxygenase LigAB LigA subunit domain-containing protein n=1 Tax=Ferruginivarius sediminum TaxID=2661937 RepID=A0A369TH70_9PROT|nr:hypothetical protein [Ferruginivarius sediminum]RDD63487.1 hypothetical protein DRB17_03325 [Ferruginivarius sediminum]